MLVLLLLSFYYNNIAASLFNNMENEVYYSLYTTLCTILPKYLIVVWNTEVQHYYMTQYVTRYL